MNPPSPPPSRLAQWLVWGGLAVVMAGILAAFLLRRDQGRGGLAGSGPPEVLPVLFSIPDFALTNQAGRVVTQSELRGRVWLADIIFTQCAGPCPEMTRRMAELQTALPAAMPVRFVTLTTDPVHDTPAVLAAYARRFGAQAGRWEFLTGTKRQIAELAVKGLKLTALDKEPAQRENADDLFIHSTQFVLVDGRGQARAVFESDDPGMESKVTTAVNRLLQKK